jgi:putative CocE/NonD family hydrolase
MCLLLALLAVIPCHAQTRLPDITQDGISIQEVWIPMPDEVRLAASLFVPADMSDNARLPVLLEYLPYRKDESRSGRFGLYSYFVNHGYVVARVDIRGTGTSDGVLVEYEYTDQEQEDGEVVIDWLSKQSWSNGKVGMFGVSWGAFNSIQMAMRNPPALKAIIAHEGTDDIYRDDVHFMDGMMHIDSYEVHQDIANVLPRPPDYIVDDAYFEERFDTTPWMMIYKNQQHDGPFWNRASLSTDYSKIKIPTFVMGGWYDGYRDSVPRMLEKLSAPVKGLIGPWAHTFPNMPYPKPGMEWRYEAVRWFDQWLKGQETGIMDEPRFAVYVRKWHPPGVVETAPGFWRWEEGWPIERVQKTPMYLHDNHTLTPDKPAGEGASSHQLKYVPTVGVEAGGNVSWWGDFPYDQRGTDAYSLVYDSAPLDGDTEILGFPRALLNVSADAPTANWFVRVSDVAPDGTVTQVAGAGLNGAHRVSAEKPVALVPDEEFTLEYDLHFTSWIFPKGHRIRVAINNAMWPMIWPTPHPMTTTTRIGGDNPSQVVLPIVPESKNGRPVFQPIVQDPELPGFGSVPVADDTVSGYAEVKHIERKPLTATTVIRMPGNGGSVYPWATIYYSEELTHEANDIDPSRASSLGETSYRIVQGDRELIISCDMEWRSDSEYFYYEYTRRISEDGELLRDKTWTDKIPRNHH